MELDTSVNIETVGLADNAVVAPWRSNVITSEINGYIYDHVQELRDMGLDWREPRWSEKGEQGHLKEAWRKKR